MCGVNMEKYDIIDKNNNLYRIVVSDTETIFREYNYEPTKAKVKKDIDEYISSQAEVISEMEEEREIATEIEKILEEFEE